MESDLPESASGPKIEQIHKTGDLMNDPNILGILVALLAVIITIGLLFFRGKKTRIVLLVGPSESGKTSIFSQLVLGKSVDTVTSIALNEGNHSETNLVLKDLPGNERLRQKFWEENKAGARGVVFTIDAAGGTKSIRDGAEILYWILTDPIVKSRKPHIIIFANKQDLPTAKGVRVIRTSLERELTTLRLTKSASLLTTGGSNAAASKTLGKADKDFSFDHVLPLKVDFAEGSSQNANDLSPVLEWLQKIA